MPSFDVVSEVDLQELDNAINQAEREIGNRYDFKGSKSEIEFDQEKNIIKIIADDDYKMQAVIDILQGKAIKRDISLKSLHAGEVQDAASGLKKCEIKLVMGIEKDKAKEITKKIKEAKLKVQPQIQDDKLRVSGKKKDDLQEVIGFLKENDFGIPLQFENFRD